MPKVDYNQTRKYGSQALGKIFKPAIKAGGVLLNIADAFGKMFGVNLTKYVKGKKYDWTNLQQAVSKAFQEIEIKTSKQLSDITKKMEELLSMPGGSNLRKVIYQAKRSYQDEYNRIQKKQAEIELDKVNAGNLSSDLSNASLGDWLTDDATAQKKKDLQTTLSKYDTSGNRKEVPGWENSSDNSDLASKIEQPV